MHLIEQEVIQRFQHNLQYLQKNHPKVYNKISVLNTAIENNLYTEKYSLEYMNNNYFDIQELSSGNYMYNQDTNQHADMLADSVNYIKSDNVIEGFYNVSLTEAQVERLDGKIDVNTNLFATAKIIQYNKQVTSKNDSMQEIFKFVFCGVGLGLHLEKTIQKIHPSLVFIVETNIELFRLSLFLTDYAKLSTEATLHLSIMDNDKEFGIIFKEFFTQGYTHNHYIKYSLLSEDNGNIITKIQDNIVRSNHLIRPYSKHLKEFLKAPEYLVENYSYLDVSKDYLSTSPFFDKPILIIASGPSLGKNLKWLKDNQDKFIIFAVLSSLKTLYTMDIKPDVVTHIDGQSISIKFFQNIDKDNFLKDTIFLFSSIVSRNIIDAVKKENIFLFETSSSYKKGSKIMPMPSIGEVTYTLGLVFGAREIYLLGLDLALDSETKSTHSKEHPFYKEVEKKTKDNVVSLKDSIFYVKGNFQESVPITAIYHLSVEAFSNICRRYKKDEQKVYNLNDGAYLEGVLPLHAEDIDISNFNTINKVKYLNQFHEFLQSISENSPNKIDIQNIDFQLQSALKLLKKVNRFKKHALTNSYTLYIKDFYKLYTELLNLNNKIAPDISRIFSAYLQLIVSYIFDILNTENLEDKAMHIKNIHTIYSNQLLKILNLYCTTMGVYKEWIEKSKG